MTNPDTMVGVTKIDNRTYVDLWEFFDMVHKDLLTVPDNAIIRPIDVIAAIRTYCVEVDKAS